MELFYVYPYNVAMNLDGIDVYVKVVQAGSFTEAAKRLKMPITTVSGKIAALEKRLGVTLIQRTTRKLHVTAAGESFFEHCVRAMEEIQAAESKLSTSKNEPEGLLKITAPADFGHTVLPQIVQKYMGLYPKVKMELILTNRFVDLIGEGVDLAIRVGRLRDSSLISKKLLEIEAGIWASPLYLKRKGTPRSPKELSHHEYVEFAGRKETAKLTKGRDSVVVKVASRLVVDDMEAVKSFVLSGSGIGTLPQFLCDNEERSGKLVRVLPQWNWGTVPFSIVYPPQKFVPSRVQAFIEVATELMTLSGLNT